MFRKVNGKLLCGQRDVAVEVAMWSERCSSRGCYVVIAARVYGCSASGSSNSYGQ